MSDQVILKSNQFHFFKCKRSSNEFLGSHRDTSGKTSTGTMCYLLHKRCECTLWQAKPNCCHFGNCLTKNYLHNNFREEA